MNIARILTVKVGDRAMIAAGSRKKSAVRPAQPAVVPAENKKKIQEERNLSKANGCYKRKKHCKKMYCSLNNAFDGREGQDI